MIRIAASHVVVVVTGLLTLLLVAGIMSVPWWGEIHAGEFRLPRVDEGGQPASTAVPDVTLAQLARRIRNRATLHEHDAGMRLSFDSFTTASRIPPGRVSYDDFVMVRLLYEATRDAGLWNLHWTITDRPPTSDNIWKQWGAASHPSPSSPTASAECDELSALYAFLARREGIKGVGLFWPFPNHTVAVWELQPAKHPAIRVVVPTSQIFLDAGDSFDTRRFNAWSQKTIYEYTRQDVPDSFELPGPLVDFFLLQIDKYAGASDATLQQLRYLRESVFLKRRSPVDAAREAVRLRDLGVASAEDYAAYQNFAQDMRFVRASRSLRQASVDGDPQGRSPSCPETGGGGGCRFLLASGPRFSNDVLEHAVPTRSQRAVAASDRVRPPDGHLDRYRLVARVPERTRESHGGR
jgi:hypothetical protein